MIGDWLAVVSRVITREHTYRLTVAPAVADLQHDTRTGARFARLCGYIAIGRALAGALWMDLVDDVTTAFNREARSSAWRAAAVVYGLLLAFNVYSIAGPFTVDDMGLDGYLAAVAWYFPNAAAACLPAVLLPVAIVFTRRQRNAGRPVLLTAAIVAAVYVFANVVVVVPASRTAAQYVQAAFWRARMDIADPPRSLEAVRRELTVGLTRQDQRRARADHNRFLFHSIAARALGTFAFALIGIGLARKRGWRLPLWAAGSYVVWMGLLAVVVGAFEWTWSPQPRPIAVFPWTQTLALFVVGALALKMRGGAREAA